MHLDPKNSPHDGAVESTENACGIEIIDQFNLNLKHFEINWGSFK
jgi:hypothetical protein